MYVFDTSPLSQLFKSYYRKRFPTLWAQFDSLVANDTIMSTREVFREIEVGPVPDLTDWAKANKAVFYTPTAEEGAFIGTLYQVPHFQQNIENKKIMKGGLNADPFVIAKAATTGAAVVSMEVEKPNSVKIPNICKHFKVPCLTLEEFMEEEGWVF